MYTNQHNDDTKRHWVKYLLRRRWETSLSMCLIHCISLYSNLSPLHLVPALPVVEVTATWREAQNKDLNSHLGFLAFLLVVRQPHYHLASWRA